MDLGQQEAFDGAPMRNAGIWPMCLMDACMVFVEEQAHWSWGGGLGTQAIITATAAPEGGKGS